MGRSRDSLPYLATHRLKAHTIVNFHDGVRLINLKVKPQIERTDRRRKVDSIGFERSSSEIASIDCIHRRMIQHHTYKALTLSALIEIGSEGQRVRLTHCDYQILTQICWMHERVGTNRARLIKFEGEIRVVARRGDRMSGVDYIYCNPWGQAALKTAILDYIVGRTGDTSSAGGRGTLRLR